MTTNTSDRHGSLAVIRFRFRQRLKNVSEAIGASGAPADDELLSALIQLECGSEEADALPKVKYAVFHLPEVSRRVLCAVLLSWPHQDARVSKRLGMAPLEYYVRRMEMVEHLREFAGRLGSKRFRAEVERFRRDLEIAELRPVDRERSRESAS